MRSNRGEIETHPAITSPSRFFPYEEAKYYRFGLALGISNFLRNQFQLGLKKTLGKILQPINSYARFPEYHYLGQAIESRIKRIAHINKPKILDVGSPKCFGLFLAFHFDVEIHMTDIDEPTLSEAEILWKSIKRRARGHAAFRVQDARKPLYAQDFDIVYSMSVIEHVEGNEGDSQSIREMIRALKPGGLLLVTVPLGPSYIEQERVGFQGAARKTGDRKRYFFQRIYSPAAVEERIMMAVSNASLRQAITVWRKTGLICRVYRHLGTNLRGAIGILNPVLSAVINKSREGIFPPPSEYGQLHTQRDLYGDLMLRWVKHLIPHTNSNDEQ